MTAAAAASARPTLVLAGPTATGKTVLAAELARRLGAELVNADARQVVRRLHVGTAAPTSEQLGGVRCHLLDETEPGQPLAVTGWLDRARAVLGALEARATPAIVVGGTGQYVRALREGWMIGGHPPEPALRAELTATASTAPGLATLVTELRDRDPAAATVMDTANPRRVVRALELLRAGAPSVATARGRSAGLGAAFRLVVLDAERTLHRSAVTDRVVAMFASGALVGEVRTELARGTSAEVIRRAGIGYGEAIDLLAGEIDEEGARQRTVARTLRYAKAQRTWFRAEPALLWLERDATDAEGSLAERILQSGVLSR